jgi:phosphoribosylformylglycinamidine synthase
MRNNHLEYRCQWTHLRVENDKLPFTNKCHKGQLLEIPISHYEGNYYADEATMQEIESNGQVAFRYCNAKGEPTAEANPNGSLHNIAGIVSKRGNVLGMMPHPERACEKVLGGTDGLSIFESIVRQGVGLLTA